MKQYIKPEVHVVDLDMESVIMVGSPIGWGDGETTTMEATPMRRSSGWEEYEGR